MHEHEQSSEEVTDSISEPYTTHNHPRRRSSDNTETRLGSVNLAQITTTIGTALILAALTWVGSKASDNNDKLTKLDTSLPYLQTSISRLDSTIATLVTRSELDSKLLDVKSVTDNKIGAIAAELLVTKRNIEVNDKADQEAHTRLQVEIEKQLHNK